MLQLGILDWPKGYVLGSSTMVVYTLKRLLQRKQMVYETSISNFLLSMLAYQLFKCFISRTQMQFHCMKENKKHQSEKLPQARGQIYRVQNFSRQRSKYKICDQEEYGLLYFVMQFSEIRERHTIFLIDRTREQELQMYFNSLMTDFMTKA